MKSRPQVPKKQLPSGLTDGSSSSPSKLFTSSFELSSKFPVNLLLYAIPAKIYSGAHQTLPPSLFRKFHSQFVDELGLV